MYDLLPKDKVIKFAVFTDLHYDDIYDGDSRIQWFIENIKGENLDFIINLGDFCAPTKKNIGILQRIKELKIPMYSVIGNHDTDYCDKNEIIQFLNMKSNYYSFTKENIKFIILDSCYYKEGNKVVNFYKGNFKKSKGSYPIVPNRELYWLRKELNSSEKYYVIFSHHSLENDFSRRGIFNRIDIRDILEEVKQYHKEVLFCMNGHDHGIDMKQIKDIYYIGMNSMSYIWLGSDYEDYCYNEDIHKKYPYIKDLALYKEPLYAIVDIDKDGSFSIKGTESTYLGRSPEERGFPNMFNNRCTSSKNITISVNNIRNYYLSENDNTKDNFIYLSE